MNSLNTKTISFLLCVCLLAIVSIACNENKNEIKTTETNTTVEAPKVDLHQAVLYGNLEAVKQHIEAGSNLNQKEPMGGSTPLISAITFDHQEIAKALIEAGADLEIQNNDGASALHAAAFFCRIEIVEALVKANADKSKKNNYGATALESISGPFEEIKPVYEMMQVQLAPLGLNLNLSEIEKNRPVVAELLK